MPSRWCERVRESTHRPKAGGPPVAWRDDATDRRGNPSDTYELVNRTGSRCARSSRRSVESSAWLAETTTNSAHWTRTRAAVSAWHAIAPADSAQQSPRSGAPAPHKAEKALRIVGAREFLAHHAHEAAT